MAKTNFTPDRIGVDLEAPFGVRLGGALLAEHPTADAALAFAESLRRGINNTQRSAIDKIDLIQARIHQVGGMLNLLTYAGEDAESGFLVSHESVMATLWAAGELLEQCQEAARSL